MLLAACEITWVQCAGLMSNCCSCGENMCQLVGVRQEELVRELEHIPAQLSTFFGCHTSFTGVVIVRYEVETKFFVQLQGNSALDHRCSHFAYSIGGQVIIYGSRCVFHERDIPPYLRKFELWLRREFCTFNARSPRQQSGIGGMGVFHMA